MPGATASFSEAPVQNYDCEGTSRDWWQIVSRQIHNNAQMKEDPLLVTINGNLGKVVDYLEDGQKKAHHPA
jgi:hypothetical protein